MDPIELEIFKSLFIYVAEEMGVTLRRTAFSPNIKERRDYSCAIYNKEGLLVAQGDHMPVHLGSMPMAVRRVVRSISMKKGDVVILNDPFEGGTHLPDITMITAVFIDNADGTPFFYVASRAHHSDIGGIAPGSMALTREIYQEGLRIPAVKLVEEGKWNEPLLNLILSNVRTPSEREGDLTAQLSANRVGEKRLLEMVRKYGKEKIAEAMSALIDYTASMVQKRLEQIPDGTYKALDFLDDDGISPEPIPIQVAIQKKGKSVLIDFNGSSHQVEGNLNAVFSITHSAVAYVLRALLPEEVPANAGILSSVQLIAPSGTVVNAIYPASVAGGNVETSQRVVDVLLRALHQAIPELIPAASSGTMNNLSFGGLHYESAEPFTYYETIGGGMGGGPLGDGDSAVQTHMTNSLNTPIETMEYNLPIRVKRYAIREGSGGKGEKKGGDGIIREIEFLQPMTVSILSDRRKFAPYGLLGGEDGKPGENILIRQGQEIRLPSKKVFSVQKGDLLRIETPGGGGWGMKK
ncbi:5-oxoprolinase [Candidatus Methylacidiphilum fumarolicum]|uniref:N-methylhydantoinase B/acetone carboxylase, alpha subunit n=2 Tax=Candidatus Methylacidiphilum fumarolicum TaxID=591154 RepID=I0JZR2_METFB|nr:hydantoinase B/oxoprolinase family protein [Candidatus Methylacidiphilum fumarolicum]TFE67671.1 5-oxoprolinase [Candidatus Methylacidiphilum fumarolicum]TFE72420.1 5-oxoprolinase [Candidatus Methylacidiphilum fumarolicum]TFE72438.1 5-oxoprolinase [Candidatus Methylacidiphilum fumarolicum]TFE77795.1 5-oxoprolinase [Candidatus Methylacidiphilum fumarolicum]CAI9085166.1 N-methylhydantoinase B/acetone carboxylase, alpha subunit [Candidatus Methylacidiphilum fumarolicum]